MEQILQVFLPLIFNRHLLQEIEIQNGGNFDRLLALWVTNIITGQYISRRLLWAIFSLTLDHMDSMDHLGVIVNGLRVPEGP